MAIIITDQSHFNSVRRAIDVTLDDQVDVDADRILPDAVIGDDMYAGLAEAEFFTWVPASTPWPGTLTEAQQPTAINAIILLTASYVYPAIPQIIQEAFGEHRYRREFETVADVVARLRGQALNIASGLLEELDLSPLGKRTSRFRAAGSDRGRWG